MGALHVSRGLRGSGNEARKQALHLADPGSAASDTSEAALPHAEARRRFPC